jgi:long-chain-alcohol oxidase
MVLDPGELRTLGSVCDALLQAGPSTWRASVPERASTYLRFLAPRELGQVRLCLRLLEAPAAGLLLPGKPRWSCFSELSRAERGRVLGAITTCPVPLVRAAFEGFKRLAAVAYYADAPEGGPNPIWQQMGYPGPLVTGTHDTGTIRLFPIRSDITLDCDVVVVGSGPGGAVVAGELARRGWDVVVLEQGPDVADEDFDQREVATLQRLYLDGGLAATRDRGVTILAGSCLGGGSVVNFSTSFRTPEAVRREWAAMTGSPVFAAESFNAALDRVCERLGVNTRHNRPAPRDELLARGLSALRWHLDTMPRNVLGCTQDEVCGYCGLGCVRGAKQSMLKTYLRDASEHGARFVVKCTAERIAIGSEGATGIRARTAEGCRVLVRARATVIAAGALHSPALLLRSGVRGHVGRNLRLHPVTAVWGRFDEPVLPWTGTLQAYYSNQFADLHDGYGARLETAPVHPAYLALGTPWHNPDQFDARMRDLAHLSLIGVLLRDRSAGRVRIDRTGRPVVHYALGDQDQGHIRTAVVAAARALRAAGAREIAISQYRHVAWNPEREGLDSWLARAGAVGFGAHQTIYGSWHQMGTCRIGHRTDSPVDQFGELRAVRNAYVADASLFPTPSGANPMVTIAALAYQVAQNIDQRLRQLTRP